MKLFAAISAILFVAVFALTLDTLAGDYGSWSNGTTKNEKSFYALTINDSGNIFGQWCSAEDKNCYWQLGLSCDATLVTSMCFS